MSSRRRAVDCVRQVRELEAQTSGVSPEDCARAIGEGINAIRKQLEALAARTWDPADSRAWRLSAKGLLQRLAKDAGTGDYAEEAKRLVREEPGVVDHLEVARAVQQTTSAVDMLYRLVQFAMGLEDSRPGKGEDWLRKLSAEQFRVVQGWVEAG